MENIYTQNGIFCTEEYTKPSKHSANQNSLISSNSTNVGHVGAEDFVKSAFSTNVDKKPQKVIKRSNFTTYSASDFHQFYNNEISSVESQKLPATSIITLNKRDPRANEKIEPKKRFQKVPVPSPAVPILFYKERSKPENANQISTFLSKPPENFLKNLKSTKKALSASQKKKTNTLSSSAIKHEPKPAGKSILITAPNMNTEGNNQQTVINCDFDPTVQSWKEFIPEYREMVDKKQEKQKKLPRKVQKPKKTAKKPKPQRRRKSCTIAYDDERHAAELLLSLRNHFLK